MSQISSEIDPADETKPLILLVIGPFHSGVSVVGKLLGELEADQESLLDAASEAAIETPGKPQRFFIGSEYEAFNETELLPALSRNWIDLAPVDWALLPTNKKQNLALIAGSVIKRGYSNKSSQIILTDSRNGCLLPFWAEVIQALGYTLKTVCVVCSPHEVALCMRDSLETSLDHGFLFYTSYWLDVVPCIVSYPHCFTSFQSLADHPETELARIRHCLSLPSYPIAQRNLVSVLSDVSNCRQLIAESVESCINDQDPLPCQVMAQRIYLQMLGFCSLSNRGQGLIQLNHDIREWQKQSTSLMRAYDQLHSDFRQSRDEILLLRAANQGYAGSFSLNRPVVDS